MSVILTDTIIFFSGAAVAWFAHYFFDCVDCGYKPYERVNYNDNTRKIVQKNVLEMKRGKS